MNNELKSYIRIETILSSAFNFLISGIITALIYHKADMVPADSVSIAVDLLITCLSILILTALFSKGSLRRSKVAGIFVSEHRLIKWLGRLFYLPLLFGTIAGLTAAAVLAILTIPVFNLFSVTAIPFWIYIAIKPIFSAVLGGSATLLELYIGMYVIG